MKVFSCEVNPLYRTHLQELCFGSDAAHYQKWFAQTGIVFKTHAMLALITGRCVTSLSLLSIYVHPQ